ncbi:hypothetical protein PGT21_050340 [Puccinia graminis f. sp. tritici]|uniref:No apical meristem-associated C-terminal domain-containing protein n=1 Tax=Puccinia graminis f. sp. tritici TaxID=56615 RepID=A0A5B0LQD6_PUCGR|nr:hypothetical protein PGT21_050340 [Puccinia graminis f. sp. tritici]
MARRQIQNVDPSLDDNDDQENNDNAKKKKAPNYTELEDFEVCRAWVQVSKDPMVGTNQDGNTFWSCVSTLYHEAVPDPIRPVDSLKKRWSNYLQPSINKFRGFVNIVESRNESGASAEDQLNRALRLYSQDQGSHFKYLRCYKLLVKSPKWHNYCRNHNKKGEKKRARSPSSEAPASTALASTPAQSDLAAPSDPVSDFKGTSTDPQILQRPIGIKKAKTLHQLAVKDQEWKEDVASAHKKIAVESTRLNDIFRDDSQSLKSMADNGQTAAQLTIMTQNLTGLDEEQQEFFKLKRAQILKTLRASSSNDP